MTSSPHFFNEFLESGLEERSSPFLTPGSRKWAINLPLKASIVAAFFLLFSFILSFFPDYLALSYLLLTLVYFFAGIPSLIGAIEDISNLSVNIDVLMTLAAFLSVLIGSGLEGGLLLVLFSLSGSIEDAVTSKAKGALSHLRNLSPPQAFVIAPNGIVFARSVKDIVIGTQILIKSGEVVPLDGIVVEGTSSVNLVHLTGENLPVTKSVGDEVQAGSRNHEAPLVLKVTRTSTESTLAKLIELITQAQEAKPKLQRWIDRLSKSYAMTIISLSLFFALIIPLFTTIPFTGDEGSIYRALAFLIAASPCALVIAIPIGYLSAISSLARRGILLKGGIILDALASCKTIAFDKTGTITTGELTLTEFIPLQPVNEGDLKDALSLALSIERGSMHPIAKAVCRFAEEKGISPLPIDRYALIPGQGIEAYHGNTHLYIGKPQYLEIPQKLEEESKLVAVLKVGKYLYLLQFQDVPRENVKPLLKVLKEKFHMRLLMLTGDHHHSAETIGKIVDLDEIYSGLLPDQKLKMVSDLSKTSGLVMIGDGINDAPALARATVGISMGKVGSTTAVDASDIVLLHDNIELLPWLISKARATKRIIFENVVVAFSAICFASIPALFGLVPLWLAVILHEGGTVIVGLNSLRLLKGVDHE